VALRGGASDPTDADAPVRARDIFDDDRLTESQTKPFANHAPE
jgi:hypothetical protein